MKMSSSLSQRVNAQASVQNSLSKYSRIAADVPDNVSKSDLLAAAEAAGLKGAEVRRAERGTMTNLTYQAANAVARERCRIYGIEV